MLSFVSVSASSLWILTFAWLLFCKHVEGVTLLSAAPGDDVILPCRLDSEEDLQDHTVEWTNEEIEPDPSGRRCVYLYQNRRTMTRFMMETFIQRVSLNPDGLKRGDVTLKIRNVTLQDEGKYSCFIPGKKFRETVQLLVEPNGVRAPTMETSQFNISTPDPGGEQNNIMSSHSIMGMGSLEYWLYSSSLLFVSFRGDDRNSRNLLQSEDVCSHQSCLFILRIKESFSSCSHMEALCGPTAMFLWIKTSM